MDRPQRGERALLLHPRVGASPLPEEQEEFAALALSAGADVVGSLSAHLRRVNPRLLIGTGKLEELHTLVKATDAELVLVDHKLSPGQQRNLEKALCIRVVDRTELILDIFALRAHTHEGKLQVELAQLEHLATRLVRGWTHLERQKGGIGLRGPGETQLETDRRLVAQRIRQLESRLARVARHRQVSGQQRRRGEVPTISLVGYTNAGKSTLFNRLTDASVLVADQLFATLDPTLRRVALPDGGHVVMADTVGFIRELPHELVAAFRSTLEETRDSRLLLHVVDAADPARDERIEDVITVLKEIGADHLPRILVYNKIDILPSPPRVDRAETGMPVRIWLSSRTGAGVDALPGIISEFLHKGVVRGTAELTVTESRLRAHLYQLGVVVAERSLDGGGWELDLEMDSRGYEDLNRREHLRFRPLTVHEQVKLQPAAGH